MRVYRRIAEDVPLASIANAYEPFTLSELRDHRIIEAAQIASQPPPLGIIGPRPRCPSLARYRSMIALEAGKARISPEKCLTKSRTRRACYVRFRVWRELRHMGFSWTGIGKVAGKNHATIIVGVRRIEKVNGNAQAKTS